MNKQELIDIVDSHIKKMKWATMTNMWSTSFRYEFTQENNLAQTEADPSYKRAEITFNPSAFENAEKEHVLDTLRHELLHLHLARLDTVMQSAVNQMTSEAAEAYIDWYHEEIEQCITSMEEMLDHGCGMRSEKMANQEFKEIE